MEFERIADKKRQDFITGTIQQYLPEGAEVLDFGCGNGIISKAVAMLGYRVTAVDISEKTIEQARIHHAHPLISYQTISAGKLPIGGPALFDAIICSEVLEHLQEPDSILRELYPMLKNEGLLLVTVPNGRGPRELLVTRPMQYLQNNNGVLSRFVHSFKRLLGYRGVTVQSSADDLSHIQFFTVTSLNKLAAVNRYRIEYFRKSNFIEQGFPFSLFIKKSRALQKIDCKIAEKLPLACTSGFMMLWKKN